MSRFDRISWKQGLFLSPQHFQQAERSYDSELNLRLLARSPLQWGLISLRLDENLLAQGQVQITQCKAILKDGTPIDIPNVDRPPPSRNIEISTGASKVDIYLAMPLPKPGQGDISEDLARTDIRYIERKQIIQDTHDSSRTQEIALATKNIRVLLEGDQRDHYSYFKVAEVRRSENGELELNPDYIPPALHIAASPKILRTARDIHGLISSRAASLAAHRRERASHVMEFSASDISSFWFLHTLNMQAGSLRHLIELRGTHPETLYRELLRLAGSLSTFALKEVAELPLYDHENQSECFLMLEETLRGLLKVLFTTRYEIIPLTKTEGYWIGQITNRDLMQSGRFILVARSPYPPEELIHKLPSVIKIADPTRIDHLLNLAISGVRVDYMPRPPRAIPSREDALYFQVQTQGQHWEQIQEAGEIAAWCPSNWPGLSFELIGIRGGD